MSINEYAQEKSSREEIVEEARDYDVMWEDFNLDEATSEDEEFVYLELEVDEDIEEEFHDLGRELKARSTGVVNGGERYLLAVEK